MKIIYLLLILLLFPFVSASVFVEAGSEHVLTTIPVCYDQIDIKVREQYNGNISLYGFKKCAEVSTDRWKCECSGNGENDIVLLTDPNSSNELDVVVQYYIKSIKGINDTNVRHSATRTLNFNDIRIAPEVIKSRFTLNLPDGMDVLVVVVAVLVAFTVFGYLFFLLIRVFLSDDPMVKEEKKVESVEDELEDIFRDL